MTSFLALAAMASLGILLAPGLAGRPEAQVETKDQSLGEALREAHRHGGFLGAWLGGLVFEAWGSYLPIWIASIVLGLIAATLHWPISERPVARLGEVQL
ncbi:MAG: hypothetical protein ACTSUD_08230 [Alphaproteobacteria bacterium]